MKKRILLALTVVGALLSLVGCGNKQIFDTTYTFDKAIVCLQDGTVISGEIGSWKDFEDGDQIQVTIDGVTYLVHSSNITMIAE